jgi:glyoxylase-like metal-dependent hydrolase (beta-lactamase superfamily II)
VLPLVLVAAATGLSDRVGAQRPQPPSPTSTDIEVLPVQGNIHVIITGGSNVVVQAGPIGAVLVDSGTPAVSAKVLAEVAKLTSQPVRYIINTNIDPDHISANEAIMKAGAPMPGTNTQGVPIIGYQKGVDRLSEPGPNQVPSILWPNDTFSGPKKTLHINGEPIDILHAPAAHSDADLMVHFRRSDVLAAGDVFSTQTYPVFHAAQGGSIQGTLDALNRPIDITVAEFNQQGGTLVVPAHGRITNESDVVEIRDMATIVRDRIRLMIERGQTLEQVKAARPTLEYDGIYGADTGPWTTAMFIEAIYNDLTRTTKPAPARPGAARPRAGRQS